MKTKEGFGDPDNCVRLIGPYNRPISREGWLECVYNKKNRSAIMYNLTMWNQTWPRISVGIRDQGGGRGFVYPARG